MKRFHIILFSLVAALSSMGEEPADTVVGEVEESIVLDEFVVTARKELIKVDAEKVSYEAQEDADAQSLSALDMLRRVPMVSVDGQDNITVNGRSDFQIYVDGKPNPMLSANPGQLLRAIPAGSIARIEVINNPGAAYDAEGVGGILNIIMKSAGNLNGYTATLTGVAGTQSQNGSVYAMLQQDKIGITANVSDMHYESSPIKLDISRLGTADGSLFHSVTEMESRVNSLNASLSVDWKPDEINVFSISGSFQRTPIRSSGYGPVSMVDAQGQLGYSYDMNTRAKMRYSGITAGADYTHIFGKDGQHKLQLAYRLNVSPTRVSAVNEFFPDEDFPGAYMPTDYETSDRTSMMENIGQVDYALPLGEKHTFALGSKLTFRRSESDAEDLDYVHHSNITAAYLNYAFKTDRFSLNAGARYENTHQSARYGSDSSMEPYSSDYNNFVPSANVSYSFTPVRTLSAGYNMRISRPGINMLNPYVNTTNPLQVSTGNPNLTPEKYNNFNLTWSAMWGKVMFNAQGGYSFSDDGITQITVMREGITYSSYLNTLRSRQVSLSLFLTYSPWSKTRITLNSSTFYSSLSSPEEGLKSHGWSENYMAAVQQTLPWELKLSANIFGQSGGRQLQMTTGSVFTHMLSLSRAFVGDRLNVSVTAMSPFCGSNKISIHEWGNGMDNHSVLRINLRSVSLSVSYRFGDLKRPKTQRRELDSDLINSTQSGSGISSGTVSGVGL